MGGVMLAAPLLRLPAEPPVMPPKRILVLHWEGRNHPANVRFDEYFQAALQSSAPGGIDYYSEELETTRFPGENQSQLLMDYLRRKYAGKNIDVLVTASSPTLEFLLKYRRELFAGTPIVFANERPVSARIAWEASATGIIYVSTYAETVGLSLRLHPGTEHLFVVSGTPDHSGAFESIARDALRDYQERVSI